MHHLNSLRHTLHANRERLLISQEFAIAFLILLILLAATTSLWVVVFSDNTALFTGASAVVPFSVLGIGYLFDVFLFALIYILGHSRNQTLRALGELTIKLEEKRRHILDLSKEKNEEIEHAKNEFVALASHQLRTPLSTINWYAEILLDGDAGALSPEQKKYIKKMYANSKRMVALIQSILNVSRIELHTFAITPHPISLVRILDACIRRFKSTLEHKSLNIKKKYPRTLPLLSLDEVLLTIVLDNLLDNAIKYTPRQGNITIGVTNNEQAYTISVADTGKGIPKEQQKRIFTKLFRADNVRSEETTGSGLGLHIAQSILRQAGCDISFISEEHEGSIFFVHIPLRGMKGRTGVKGLIV